MLWGGKIITVFQTGYQPTCLSFWLPIPYKSAHLISSPFACAEILNESVRGTIHKGMTVTFIIISN